MRGRGRGRLEEGESVENLRVEDSRRILTGGEASWRDVKRATQVPIVAVCPCPYPCPSFFPFPFPFPLPFPFPSLCSKRLWYIYNPTHTHTLTINLTWMMDDYPIAIQPWTDALAFAPAGYWTNKCPF